jgi:hypothetical protein
MATGPYSRVYWSVMDDQKFDGIREDVRHFGSWTVLLIVADMAHPAPAFIPGTIPKASIRALSECGLIDLLSGGRFRVHGLASERGERTQSARNAAAKRWHSGSNADPMLDETRRDEHRQDKKSSAQSAYLKEYREAVVEVNGNGLDEPTVEPLPMTPKGKS